MKILKSILIILCSLLLISCSQDNGPVLHDTEGKPVQLSKLKGKWVIINYWADWCGSCVYEMPELNDFYQHNQDKNIAFYGVNYDHLPLSELKEAVKKTEIEFPVLVEDPNQAWHLDDVFVLPMTFIINPKGKLVKTIVGPNSEKSLLDTLQTLQS